MIGRNAPRIAARQFKEWASIFRERIFVMLIAHVDESYTNDMNGVLEHVTFAGYVASKEDWGKFCVSWAELLERKKIPWFHFREYADKDSHKEPDNAYFGWTDKERGDLLYDLAEIAGENAIPFGGTVPAKEHIKFNRLGTPIEAAISNGFKDLVNTIQLHWPALNPLKDGVHVVYDQTQSSEWLVPVHEAFREYKQDYPFLTNLTEADDKKTPPLQAADLLAYSTRQNGIRGVQSPRILDLLLAQNIFPKGDIRGYHHVLSKLLPMPWAEAIAKLREQEVKFKKTHPKTQFLPFKKIWN